MNVGRSIFLERLFRGSIGAVPRVSSGLIAGGKEITKESARPGCAALRLAQSDIVR
jgi:hypothetical protein